MSLSAPTVRVRLTPEEKNAIPDWQEKVAMFQRECDERTKDKRERFRVCLHEGGHTVQYRNQFRWDVDFLGPYVSYEDGELHFVAGAVSPIRTNGYKPHPCQDAMVSISGFWAVEHFTAVPNEPCVIQNDLKTLRSKLEDAGENADMNEAVFNAKIMLSEDLRADATFFPELERAVRDYELAVYCTDEATTWGWREYHPELPGNRHRVIVPYSGNWGTLVEHNGDLKLVVEGKVFRPEDDLRGGSLEVRIAEPQKAGTHRVVQEWNRAVSCEVITG
jgi:hypothetical protein